MATEVQIKIVQKDDGQWEMHAEDLTFLGNTIEEVMAKYTTYLQEKPKTGITLKKAWNIYSIKQGWASYQGWAVYQDNVYLGYTASFSHRYKPEFVAGRINTDMLQIGKSIGTSVTRDDMILVATEHNKDTQRFVEALGRVSRQIRDRIEDVLYANEDSWSLVDKVDRILSILEE